VEIPRSACVISVCPRASFTGDARFTLINMSFARSLLCAICDRPIWRVQFETVPLVRRAESSFTKE